MALAQMGVQALAALLVIWSSLPEDTRSPAVARWLDGAVSEVLARRAQAEALGRAYYRLTRALTTGRTIQDPFTPEPKRVTLGKLRNEFISLASPWTLANAPGSTNTGNGTNGAQQGSGTSGRTLEQAYSRGSSDDSQVDVDPAPQQSARQRAARDAAATEARIVLGQLGPGSLQRQLDEINRATDKDLHSEGPSIQEVDQSRKDARDKAGRAMSGAADRVVMNGGRSTVWNYQDEDNLCVGWARISLTGTPCGWCAMLISRGPVYKSERSATSSDRGVYTDGDRYHDYCHCVAVPVFESDLDDPNDPRFELNRKYAAMWQALRQGRLTNPNDKDGDSFLTIWRRYLRNNPG